MNELKPFQTVIDELLQLALDHPNRTVDECRYWNYEEKPGLGMVPTEPCCIVGNAIWNLTGINFGADSDRDRAYIATDGWIVNPNEQPSTTLNWEALGFEKPTLAQAFYVQTMQDVQDGNDESQTLQEYVDKDRRWGHAAKVAGRRVVDGKLMPS